MNRRKQMALRLAGAILSIAAVASLGVYLLFSVNATTASVSIDVTAGVQSGPTATVRDANTSKGFALRFGTFTPPSGATTPAPTPTPAPKPSLPIVTGKNTSYSLGVLVLKYFPLTSNGQNINIAVTGDVGDPFSTIKQRTTDITNNLLQDLPKATTYLADQYPGNSPSLTYHIVNTIEHDTAVPINSTIHSGFPTYPDYYGIMQSSNICSYVDGQGVREVWLFAYQGPSKPGTTQPYLGIEESKMSGPHGDISNSYEWNDMPVCKNTYVVYTFNYGRGTGEAMHSWGHQIESELRAVDSNLFGLFQGPAHPQTTNQTGRCGSVHNPPNASSEYDWSNITPWPTDCLDWNPNSLGTLTKLSCQTWGCNYVSDNDNSQLNWQIWMWQHLPGTNNIKTYSGKQLRNWWDIHGNFDSVISASKRLTTT